MSLNRHIGNPSAEALGIRLRAARELAGLSTRIVERRLKAAGLVASHTTIANYEHGSALPSEQMLRFLAELYDQDREWFFGADPILTGVRYRCLKSVRVRDKRSYERHAMSWFRAYFFAEAALERPPLPRIRIEISDGESPEDVATRIRKEFGFGTYPIPSVSRLLEEFGIRIIQLESEARIDGFAGRLDEKPVVVINSELPNDRIRLNAAHELAHHIFEDCAGTDIVDEDVIEQRAFECASHLLIPDEQLRDAFQLKSMVRLVQYKERFGVSLAAMIYRARRANILPARLYERLWREFSKRGWRTEEPGAVAPDRPRRMEALIDAAVSQKKTKYEEVAGVAGLPVSDVRKRVSAAIGVVDEVDSTDYTRPLRFRSVKDDA